MDGELEVARDSGDNKLKAIVAMNLALMCATGMAASYRVIAREGFHPAELNLVRSTFSFIVGLIWCVLTKTNPLYEFPVDKKMPLFGNLFFGNFMFLTTNIACALAPICLVMVCRQTSSFWASLLAFVLLGEAIYPLEIIGMFLCFGAVIMIAMQQREEKLATQSEEDNPYDQKLLGILVACLGGVIVAFYAVAIRALKTVKT